MSNRKLNVLSDIDDYEQKVGAKLRQDFPEELNVFEQALDVLAKCINQFMLGRPDLAKEIVTTDYRELKSGTLGFFVSSVLLSEALTRLFAARNLFLHGYLSRAVASTRDALESAMVSSICKNNDMLSKKWLKGKQIKLTDKYKYNPIFSWKIWGIAQAIMNPLGTHSYLEATFLSTVLQQAILFPDDDEFRRQYMHDAKYVLRRMLLRCYQMLIYIKYTYPEAMEQVNNFDNVLSSIMPVLESELQLSLDEQLIIKNIKELE